MLTFKRSCVLLLVIVLSACSGSSSLSAPTNLTVTVSSPNTNVLFGATEQMSVAASDGRALTGTWTSDNTSVATVSSTGLVTMAKGGFLVGVGTTLGNGCTSGHGLCGISRLSPRSIVATMVFVAIGMLTVALTRGRL